MTDSNIARQATRILPVRLTEQETAEQLDISVRTLQAWRGRAGYGPAFIKIGGRVRYSQDAIDAYLASRAFDSTGEYQEQRAEQKRRQARSAGVAA